jgi:hypothetical protein
MHQDRASTSPSGLSGLCSNRGSKLSGFVEQTRSRDSSRLAPPRRRPRRRRASNGKSPGDGEGKAIWRVPPSKDRAGRTFEASDSIHWHPVEEVGGPWNRFFLFLHQGGGPNHARRPTGAIAVLMEHRFQGGLQISLHHHLRDSVGTVGNAERPRSAIAFWEVYSSLERRAPIHGLIWASWGGQSSRGHSRKS